MVIVIIVILLVVVVLFYYYPMLIMPSVETGKIPNINIYAVNASISRKKIEMTD